MSDEKERIEALEKVVTEIVAPYDGRIPLVLIVAALNESGDAVLRAVNVSPNLVPTALRRLANIVEENASSIK